MAGTSPAAVANVGPDVRPGLRWSIRLQLLVPMVAVVLLASLLATAITACWIAWRVRSEQREDLRRVVKTLGESAFPLTGPVLGQMRGLSGAEFLLLGPRAKLEESTLSLEKPWLDDLAGIARAGRAEGAVANRTVFLKERNYLVDWVDVTGRHPVSEPTTLFILYAEDQLAFRIRQAVYPALIAGLVAAGTALLITTWLAQRFARPIGTLVAQTATIAQGDFAPMPVTQRNDELRDLIESINRMAQQLAEYEFEVRRHERLKTLGQFGASLAHQLRNAATGGRMAIELHRRDCPQGAGEESLEVALRQLQLMESYLRQFLTIGRAAPAVRERVNMTGLVEEVLTLVRPSYAHAGIELAFTPSPEPMFICGDPEGLRQLVTNLALNAADAALSCRSAPPRVEVELTRAANTERTADDCRAPAIVGGSLRVRDSGPGPDTAVSEQLFDAFVTTKPDGCGLGLFVARQIAERHNGRLHWRRERAMTCFQFDFPLA
jgi:signal transduction histidine kinase